MLKRILIAPFLAIIFVYQHMISPLTRPACRFQPTCSCYAKDAFVKYGVFKGAWLATRRIASCHPWGKSGYDPVP